MPDETETTETKEGTTTTTAPELTQDKVNELIEKARKQEKDKLYGKIEELTSVVSTLKSTADEEKVTREKIEREAREKAESERTAKLSVEDKFAEQFKKFEEKLEQDRRRQEDLERRLQESEDKRELQAYKEKVLQENREKLGPMADFVHGASKDDIDKSVATAATKYQEIFKAVTEAAKGETKRDIFGNLPSPANPDPGDLEEATAEMGKLLTNDVLKSKAEGKISKDYEKNREALLDQVTAMYNRQRQ